MFYSLESSFAPPWRHFSAQVSRTSIDKKGALKCLMRNVGILTTQKELLKMPSVRQAYTVTIPEELPVTAFPLLKRDMRRKNSTVSGSVLVSTFVGLLINHAKV